MAFSRCKKCGYYNSNSAGSCSNCGAEKTTGGRWIWLIGVAVLLVFGGKFLSNYKHDTAKPSAHRTDAQPKTVGEVRRESIEKGFSAWDGSHRELEKMIKQSMNDPRSYEHVETRYSDQGDHLIVITTFRGKNAFGGTVKNSVTARASLEGQVVTILSEGQ